MTLKPGNVHSNQDSITFNQSNQETLFFSHSTCKKIKIKKDGITVNFNDISTRKEKKIR